MIEITARHMEGGEGHEHIASVRWVNPADGTTGENSRAGMVDWIDNKGGRVCVRDGDEVAIVGVIRGTPPFLQTHFDNKWSDHLLRVATY